jgi:hypothetical protein
MQNVPVEAAVEQIGVRPISIARESTLIIGGALMVIGSYEPWTHGSLTGPSVVLHRNGLQLGFDHSFSVAGLISIAVGFMMMLSGAIRLAERTLPRPLDLPPLIGGLIGVGVGLFGLGNANLYTKAMLHEHRYLFVAGTSYGIWFVLVGGTGILLVGLISREPGVIGTRIVLSATFATALIALGAFALTPK